MRHRKSGRKLGRNSSHRAAMFRNMATSLIEEERIQTTAAKAKELRGVIEKLIALGRRNAPSVVANASNDAEKARLTAARVAAVRQAGKLVRNRFALQKLFGDLAERYDYGCWLQHPHHGQSPGPKLAWLCHFRGSGGELRSLVDPAAVAATAPATVKRRGPMRPLQLTTC